MANNLGATFQGDLLKLWLNGTAIANIADNAASAPLTNLYLALHTADPTNSGNQSSSEIAYTSYARVAIARTPGSPAWTITGSNPAVANPNAAIVFPTPTGGSGTATHCSIGTASSGTGKILASGPITPNITIVVGSPPTLPTTTSISMN